MNFTTKAGQRIVCDSMQAFYQIRREYFPSVAPELWKLDGVGYLEPTPEALAISEESASASVARVIAVERAEFKREFPTGAALRAFVQRPFGGSHEAH